MTREEAALILHPDTTISALEKWDNSSYETRIELFEEACRMGAEALRQHEPAQGWVKSSERLPTAEDADDDDCVDAYWEDIDGVITTGYQTVVNDERCTYWHHLTKVPPIEKFLQYERSSK